MKIDPKQTRWTIRSVKSSLYLSLSIIYMEKRNMKQEKQYSWAREKRIVGVERKHP